VILFLLAFSLFSRRSTIRVNGCSCRGGLSWSEPWRLKCPSSRKVSCCSTSTGTKTFLIHRRLRLRCSSPSAS
jgi:hypothetical protein